jgi:hypothetical protein
MTTSKQTADPDTEVRTAVPPKPVWVERSTIPCRYGSPKDSDEDDGDDYGFWYDTKEDFRNGLSYLGDPNSMLSPDFKNKTYSLPPYNEMHTTVIDGQAWCSLDDVGRFSGTQTCKSITGCHPCSSVRGYPGYLVPDSAITYSLIADGGYLHGGPWNESLEDCLKRFRKLIPDCHGRVDRREMKEFMEPRGSTNNQFDIDEASDTEWMTSEEAWELSRGSFGMTTNSLRKFGLKRITEVFCPVPPPMSNAS